MKQRQVAQHRCGSGSSDDARHRRGLAGLLAGASASAAALALSFAPQARAQAVNGTPNVVFGADAPTRTETSDSFNVVASEALIDWSVTDPAVFLNSGSTLSFNGSGGTYTVLNRVVSAPSLTSTLALNGRVQSDSQGQIWFYNPGGWAVGAGATIDVGSLLLTASPVTIDPLDPGGAPRFLGDNGQIRLGQATVAGASVSIDPLASVTSRGNSSYIALVAPRVVQAGTVNAGGSVAYVGAEAADITINAGLFDIGVTSGTTDANGVVHTGTTTGPSTFSSTPRTQFLVSVGKNDAVTMLVSGQLGYDAASSAGFVDGRIVLSSGQGITSNSPSNLGSGADGISLSGATLRNDLIASASGRIAVSAPSAAQSVTVTGDATLNAGRSVDVAVSGTAAEFAVLGDLAVSAASGAQGGAVRITLDNGGALRANNLVANADGIGLQRIDAESGQLEAGVTGENAQGGSVVLNATDAIVAIGGSTQLSSDARGGIGGAGAGSARAGTVDVTATNSATSFGEGGVTINARALSANSGRGFLIGTTGSASVGGSASVNLTGGTSLGFVVLDNSSTASVGTDQAAQAASTGTLAVSLGSGTFSGSGLQLNSFVSSADGGAASGGALNLTLSNAQASFDGIGLFGQVEGDVPTSAGAGGSASLVLGQGSTLTVPDLFLTRQTFGTVGGKVATGGDVSLAISGGSALSSANGIFLTSEARGAQVGQGAGGSGTGGKISIAVDNGTLSAGSQLSASARGTAGGSFGGIVTNETGRGGAVTLTLNGDAAVISAPNVDLSAPGSAFFGEGTLGGATGIGGSVSATVNGGSLIGNDISLSAIGSGGDGARIGEDGIPTDGGTGRGGSVDLTVNGGAVQTGSLALDAGGRGGFGATSFGGTAPAGDGGDAFGGSATLSLTGGAIATDDLQVSAGANVPQVIDFGEGGIFIDYFGGGGFAFDSGAGAVAGAGGIGTGGTASVTIDGGTLTGSGGFGGSGATPTRINVSAGGFGGNGGSVGSESGPGSAKGDGGRGIGGTATLDYRGGNANFLDLSVSAPGRGGAAGFEQALGSSSRAPAPTGGSLGADGGDGQGGTARIRIAADLDAFDSNGNLRFVSADASGIGGDAADGDIAGNGGNGIGGSASLEVDAATVSLFDPLVNAAGLGGFGSRPGLSNPGGDGGAGFGGIATLAVTNGAAFTLTGGTLLADGVGADGVNGSDGAGLGAPGDGGKGGDAQGGTANLLVTGGSTLSFNQGELGTLAMIVTGSAGNGGLGGSNARSGGTSFGNGGDGGAAVGGNIVIEAADTTLDLGNATFSADGLGGEGGGRVTDESGNAREFSIGGSGGEGQGGSIRLTAVGEGARLTFSSLDLSASGTGGSGAAGQGVDATTFAGAAGGNGAAGTGGSIIVEALSGGALTARTADSSSTPGLVTLSANGFAGIGGDGANGATNPLTGVGGAGGNGGNSGQGNGGTIAVSAGGGAVSLGSLQITANGVGRFGAFGGSGGAGVVPPNSPPATPPGANGADGAFGAGGGGVGGTVELSALSDEGGLVGGLSVGDATIDVTGTMQFFDFVVPSVGGSVSIIDRVDDSNGGVRFGSLGINASGDVTFAPASVVIESSDSPIVIDNSLNIAAAGDVLIRTSGTGGLAIGGSLTIDTLGTVQIDDDFCGEGECLTDPTISADQSISIDASGGNVLLIGAATLASGGDILIDAGGSITGGPGSGYRTPGALDLTAGGDIAVRNADVGALTARAGRSLVFIPESESVEEQYSARDLVLGEDAGGGRIVVSGELTGIAGGDVTVASAAELTAGLGLSMLSGDDIVIGGGATLTANAADSPEPGALSLDAGSIASVSEPVPGNVASLIAGGGATVDGGTGTVQLIGGAIDTRGASVSGAALFADVRNPPAAGNPQSSDSGALAAPCLEGDICLGTVTATGQVAIGQGEQAPVRFLGTGDISGDSVAIRARETLAFGAATVPVTTSANGAITLESLAGDVALTGGAALSGGSLDLAAAGSLTGNGVLVSNGDIGITVGDSVTADSITAAGQLTGFGQTGGELEGTFTVPGSFTVTTLQLGADAAISAGGDIVVGTADLAGNDVDFAAGGLVSLGGTSAVGDIALRGTDATFGALVASGDIVIGATNAVSGNGAVAGGAISINAASIDATSLRSGGDMSLTSSGDTTLGTANAGGDLAIDAGQLTFDTLGSVGATALTAADIAGGDIAAGTALSAQASGNIGLGTATAGTTLAFDGGSIDASRLQSGQAMSLSSGGPVSLGTASAGAGLAITSGALTFTGLTSTGATAIDAASVGGGDIAAGTSLDVLSSGAIQLGTATAGAGLTLNGASLAATRLQSGQGMSLTSTGATTLGTAESGAALSFDAATLAFAGLTSTGATTIAAGSVAGGDIAAGTALAVRSPGAIRLGNATGGSTLTLNGATLNASALGSGQDMSLVSSGATTLGTANSGAGLTIAAGPLTFAGLTSTGATTIDAASVAGGNIAAGTALGIRSPGSISLGTTTAGTTLTLSGDTIAATQLRSGGNMALTANGAMTLGTATSGAGLTIDAGAVTFASLASVGATTIGAGSVAGGNIDAGTSLGIVADDAIELNDAAAGRTLTIDGATLTADALTSGGDARLTAGTVDVGSIASGAGIDVSAGSATLGSIRSAGLTTVGAGSLVLDTADADGGLALTIEGPAALGSATSGAGIAIAAGDLTFASLGAVDTVTIDAASVGGGNIDAGASLDVVAAGTIDIGNAAAGTSLSLQGSAIRANALTSGSDTTLTADAVDIASIASGAAIDIAAGSVTLGSTRSAGLTTIAAGSLSLDTADAGGGLALTVEGPAALGSVNSDAGIAITAGDLTFESLASTGATSIDASRVGGGDIDAGTSLAIVAVDAIGLGAAAAGTSLNLDGAGITTTSLTSGGDTTLTAEAVDVAGIVSGAGIDIAADSAALGTIRSAGLSTIDAGTLTLTSADVTGGLALAVDGRATLGTVLSGAGVTASAGDLGFTAITAAGPITASAATIGGGDATSTGGAVALRSTGATTVGRLRAGTDVSVTGSSLSFAAIDAARDVALDIGTLNGTAIAAGQDLTIRSASGLTFGTVGAVRNVSLSASNGSIVVTTDLNAGGSATLSADAIGVQAVGDLRVNRASADNGNIAIQTDGLLRVDTAAALGDIALTSTAGSLIVGGAIAGDAPNVGTALAADTPVMPGVVGAGAITLSAASDITLLATVDANTALAATAGRLIDQRGLAVGRTVAYRSADIALGQGASLGQSNFTTGIALTNIASGTGSTGAILGDVAGNAAGYRLDNAEFARIHSGGDLSLSGGSSLTVGTLSASAANGNGGVANGNIGANSALSLTTSGELGVTGALALANAGGNTLNLSSGGALFVDAGSGSVRLTEGSASGGTLSVAAASVMALTPAARAGLTGLDTRGLDQRLSMSDGVTANRTLIEAGAVTLSSNGAILIQNTSPGISFDERRGFVAGSLTLNTSGASGPVDIVINGTVAGTTGLTALRAVNIQGSFTDFSTINGCRILSASCGNPAIDPIRDLIEEEVEVGSTLDSTADGFGQNALITIDRIEPAGFETVIDEPVTGAGNDDFLVPEAGAGDEACTADDRTKCDKPLAG